MAHTEPTIKNPGTLKMGSGIQTLISVAILVGAIATVAGIVVDPGRGWSSLLMNHFYFLSLAIGGMFIVAIQYITGAMWSAPVRRIAESFTAYLPFVLVGFIAVAIGSGHIFEWTHADFIQGDPVLEHKAGYLNLPFFIVRNVIAIVGWVVFARLIVGHSVAQDSDGKLSHSKKNVGLSIAFLVFFVITFTMSAFDHLMSLDPHRFSTMFGVYMFAGSFYSSLALTAIVTIWLRKAGYLEGIVNDNHIHDLGKFMFAFTVFWAYIAFSQYMLIWYSNLPEETMYYMNRFSGNWKYFSIFLLVGKFMVPFFALLTREAKRSMSRLVKVGFFMLFAQWVDVVWVVQPQFQPAGYHFGGLWIDLGAFIFFGGVFAFLFTRFLSKNTVVAIRDPKLTESVFHHHQ